MTQYCVIQGPLPERVNANLTLQPLIRPPHTPVHLFANASHLCLPFYRGRSFDEVLSLSKAKYLDGAPFEITDAYAMLAGLLTCERHLVLWHGRDASHLPIVDTAEDLFTALRAALEHHRCELYLDFRVPFLK